jgi:hypothetical protein
MIKIEDWGHWKTNLTEISETAIGFVYKITDKSNNKFYIGCKQLYSIQTRPPLKGKKRKRKVKKDSDWRTYCSSSGVIQESIQDNEAGYDFEILSVHDSKSSLKIEEARLIINDIYNTECYNEVVNLRCRVVKS